MLQRYRRAFFVVVFFIVVRSYNGIGDSTVWPIEDDAFVGVFGGTMNKQGNCIYLLRALKAAETKNDENQPIEKRLEIWPIFCGAPT